MRDPDATAPVPRPTPTPGGGGMTDSAVGALFDAASPAFATQRTAPSRGWEPPSVEDLQRVLPQYEISAFIARGGMGAVYKGMQRTLKRPVAIKVLPPDMGEDDGLQFAERFKREAQAMARLSHPNIVTVFEAGEVDLGSSGSRQTSDGRSSSSTSAPANGGIPSGAAQLASSVTGDSPDGRSGGRQTSDERSPASFGSQQPDGTLASSATRPLLYFVMEFIEGTDVAQLIASEGIIEPLRAIQITTAVCEALAFAHEEGIVHRDIKPSNVMIDRRGRVKVADFGLAKTVSAESTMLTRSDVAMGTPDFVAPEALIPGIAVDGRADIYAVGVMLYQMLTGKIPRGRFALPSGVVPKVDKRFDAIVDKALQTDRDQRYSTASEMKKDMEKVATRLAPSVKAEAADAASSRSSVKRPLILGIAVIAVVSIAAAWYTQNQGTEAGKLAGIGDKEAAGMVTSKPAAPFDAIFPAGKWVKPASKQWQAVKGSPEFRSDGEMKLGGTVMLADLSAAAVFMRGKLKVPAASGYTFAHLRFSENEKRDEKRTLSIRRVADKADHWSLQVNRAGKHDDLTPEQPPKFDQMADADGWMAFEFGAIGSTSFARFGSGPWVKQTDANVVTGGSIALIGDNATFRDLEVMNLDGLSETEAIKLAGLNGEPQWRNALAEEPLKSVVAKMAKSPDGYVFPQNSNRLFPAAGLRAGALRWRGKVRDGWPELAIKESDSHQFQMGISRSTRRPYIADKQNSQVKNLAEAEEYPGYQPKTGQVSEVVVARLGGKLRLLVDGRQVCEAAASAAAPWQFAIIIHGEPVPATQALDYINLDGLPEAEALKLVGVSDAGDSPSAYRFPDGPPGFVKELAGHKGEVSGGRSITILPDNRRMFTHAGRDAAGADINEAILWDVETGQPVWKRQLLDVKSVIGGSAILLAVNQVVVIHRGAEFVMEFLDLDKGTTIRQVKVETPQEGSFVTHLVAAPDGRRFMLLLYPAKAETSDSLRFQLWDAGGEKPMNTWRAPGRCDSLHTAAWLDAGRFVTSITDLASNGKVFLLLETAGAGGLRRVLENDRNAGAFFTTVPGEPGQILAHWQGSDLAVYDVTKSTMLRKFGVPRVQRQLIFVDSQRVLGLSTEWSDALRLWDEKSGKLLWEQKDERLCDAVAVSPDGRFAVTNCSTKNAAGEYRPSNKLLVWRLPKAEGEAAGDAATFGGHRYRVVKEQVTWLEAKAKAEAMGGHLATLTSKEEADFVAGLCRQVLPNKPGQAWLGGLRDRGKDTPWTWITGEPFGYSNWRSDHVYEDDQPYSLTFQPGDARKGVPDSWNNWKHTWDLQRIRDHIGGYVVEWDDPAKAP